MQAVRLVSTENLSREEWLDFRKKGLGGSDLAAIIGISPYRSALAVYYDKVGEAPGLEDNLAMELGRELEPFLRRKFEKWMVAHEGHEVEVLEEKYILQHLENKWMLANIDGKFEHPELGLCGLELKTAGEYQREHWENEQLPDDYYCQVQWYLAVTGLQTWYVGYLLGNRLFNGLKVPRNEAVIEKLITRGKDFWENNVLAKVPPAPGGFNCDMDILKKLYPEEERAKTIELHDIQDVYDEYKQLIKQQKEIELEISAIKQLFMSRMGIAEVALVGTKKITWKMVHRSGYTVEPTSFRQFRIY